MSVQGESLKELEKTMRNEIDQSLGETAKLAEVEREKYKKCEANVQELSEKIRSYMTKFDEIKDEMTTNQSKFQTYQEEIETKRLEMEKLKIEIENLKTVKTQHLTLEAQISQEKQQMQKQIDTLNGLKSALNMKQKTLGISAPQTEQQKE
jgi:chromosome segregation ATPase